MSCAPEDCQQIVELFWCRSVLVWENCHFVVKMGLLWVDADLVWWGQMCLINGDIVSNRPDKG